MRGNASRWSRLDRQAADTAPSGAAPPKPDLPAESSPGPGDRWAECIRLLGQRDTRAAASRMDALAREAPCAREVFLRRLEMAEVCMREGMLSTACGILKDLAEQAERLNLEAWESPVLLVRVWKLLYSAFAGAAPGSEESELRGKAFQKICRLAPWEALDLQ